MTIIINEKGIHISDITTDELVALATAVSLAMEAFSSNQNAADPAMKKLHATFQHMGA